MVRMTLQTQLILAAFLRDPGEARYGLEIAGEAGLPSGTIYPTLARLERAGWVESHWESIDADAIGRPRRRYYELTAEGACRGREALRATREQLQVGTDLEKPSLAPRVRPA
jgi:PadR family transcriptional regulator, regulatory protein PadR